MNTTFEFDPEKSRVNKERHGIDFIEAQELWNVPHIILPAKTIGSEERFIILGQLRRKIYMAVFVKRDEAIRLITCHRVDERFERKYREADNEENQEN